MGWGTLVGETGRTKRWLHTVNWGWAVRARYAELDRQTPVDAFLVELVARGELADPGPFDITAVCAAQK